MLTVPTRVDDNWVCIFKEEEEEEDNFRFEPTILYKKQRNENLHKLT